MKYYPPPNSRCARRGAVHRRGGPAHGHPAGQRGRAPPTGPASSTATSPANVLVSQYGAPGLTDFGIAGRGAAHDEDDDVGVSVPWAPPEVLFGQSSGDAGPTCTLAATLWQLLVGRSPFEVPGGDNTAYALMPRIRDARAVDRPRRCAGLPRAAAVAGDGEGPGRPSDRAGLRPRAAGDRAGARFPARPSSCSTSRARPHWPTRPRRSGDDDDRTRVRAPKAIRSPGPAPARPAPAAYPPPLSGSTAIPSAAHTPIATNHASSARRRWPASRRGPRRGGHCPWTGPARARRKPRRRLR